MKEQELLARTKALAVDVIRFSREIPRSEETQVIKKQLIRAASSVGANYRAACRSRSRKDFIAWLGIVAEEGDEVQYWLELLSELKGPANPEGSSNPKLSALHQEADELVAIMVASINTARARLK